MRILEIDTERTWRGGQRQTLYTLQGLQAAGVHATLLCRQGFPLHLKAQELNLPLLPVSSQLHAASQLARQARSYDLLHAQTAKAQSLAVLTKWIHRRPILYTRRVDFVPRGLLTQLKYRWTDQVVAISTPIRTILEAFGVPSVEVIPSAVVRRPLNRARAEQFRTSLGIGNRKTIGTLAALVPHKDPITMVRAIHELKRLRNDFDFLHFGEGELRSATEKAIQDLGLQGTYHLIGFQEDAEDFFTLLDVFVMSSAEEGLGSSVLDAFLYGVPVVSTDAGGLAETVANRGLLCPVRDSAALAASIHRLLDSPELRESLIQRARLEVEQHYGLDCNIQRYLEVFQRLPHLPRLPNSALNRPPTTR